MRPSKAHRPERGNSDRSRDQQGAALIEDQSTGAPRQSRDWAEAAVVEILVWGNPDATVTAVRSGAVDPAKFHNRRPVVEALIALVEDDITPDPARICDRLIEDGTCPSLARWLVLNEDGFVAADRRLSGLTYRLDALERTDTAERLRMKLAELYDDLDRPGGVDRVAETIGGGRR